MIIRLIRDDDASITEEAQLDSPKPPLLRVVAARVLDFIETCRDDEMVEIIIRPR